MAPPYGHILDPLKRHRLGAHKRDVDRDAVSTFYIYYLNIVGGYYTHIICVLTKIRGLYSGPDVPRRLAFSNFEHI